MLSTIINNPNIELEDIIQLKAEKKRELDKQMDIIHERAHNIFAPIGPATNKAESLMRTFNTGMAVYDGLMLGMKTIKRIKDLFKRKPKK